MSAISTGVNAPLTPKSQKTTTTDNKLEVPLYQTKIKTNINIHRNRNNKKR